MAVDLCICGAVMSDLPIKWRVFLHSFTNLSVLCSANDVFLTLSTPLSPSNIIHFLEARQNVKIQTIKCTFAFANFIIYFTHSHRVCHSSALTKCLGRKSQPARKNQSTKNGCLMHFERRWMQTTSFFFAFVTMLQSQFNVCQAIFFGFVYG